MMHGTAQQITSNISKDREAYGCKKILFAALYRWLGSTGSEGHHLRVENTSKYYCRYHKQADPQTISMDPLGAEAETCDP